jgi:hypothetical protein
MELIEIGSKVNAFRRSHLAEHQGEQLQLPTRANIARMAEIRLRSGRTEGEIMQAMGVDRGTLNHYITRHLGLKWKTAWRCDGRTCRYAKATPDPKESTVWRDPAAHDGDGPSGRHPGGPLPGCAPAAAPALADSWADPVGQRPAGVRPNWHSPTPACRIVPGVGTLGRTGHHASLGMIPLLRLRCRTSWMRSGRWIANG